MTSGLVAGIDVGGTKIAVGVADGRGELLGREVFPTLAERGPRTVITETITRLATLLDGQQPQAIGIGCAGPLDLAQGLVLSPPNLPGWDRVPLAALVEQALGAPARLDNDANAAAMAEYALGAGRGAQTMVYVTLSTGIGGGIVVDGKLRHGVGGGAGELGHQTIDPAGPRCGCGNVGCLEAIASGSAIVARAREAIATGRGEAIARQAGAEPLHAGHVARAAQAGDATARQIWRGAMDALVIGLGNVITTLAPDRVILGGGVTRAGELLFAPLREGLARRVRMVPMDRVVVAPALHGTDAGLVGAIALALARAEGT